MGERVVTGDAARVAFGDEDEAGGGAGVHFLTRPFLDEVRERCRLATKRFPAVFGRVEAFDAEGVGGGHG